MGSFLGHALPGSMFIVFGIWWTLRIAQIRAEKFSNGRRKSARREDCSLDKIRITFPCQCAPNHPVEAILKISLSFVGILVEIHSSISAEGLIASNMQHVTMYTMFFIGGFVDVLTFYRILVPLGVDYFIGTMAFVVEAILFYFHIEHQTSFEQMVHILLILAIFGCIVAALFEAWNPTNLEMKYLRAFFVILQGTWFYQVGFLIYNPTPGSSHPWHGPGEDMDTMWVSMMFAWHCIAIFAFQLGLSAIVWLSWNGLSCCIGFPSSGILPKKNGRLPNRETAEEEVCLIDQA